MALVGPLMILLTFIMLIKFCFVDAYPEGHHRVSSSSSGIDSAGGFENAFGSVPQMDNLQIDSDFRGEANDEQPDSECPVKIIRIK